MSSLPSSCASTDSAAGHDSSPAIREQAALIASPHDRVRRRPTLSTYIIAPPEVPDPRPDGLWWQVVLRLEERGLSPGLCFGRSGVPELVRSRFDSCVILSGRILKSPDLRRLVTDLAALDGGRRSRWRRPPSTCSVPLGTPPSSMIW